MYMAAELLIQNGDKTYIPVVQDGIEWSTERVGVPGKLVFKVHWDSVLDITEGNAVRFRWNDNNIFYGFIFKISRDKDQILTVTAYDQLRYLKNKETYVYENQRADEVVKMIASDFGLLMGELENTGYKIPSRVEDGQTLFDIIQNALDDTLLNRATMYVLYDDFGKIALKGLDSMRVGEPGAYLLIDEETGENFSYNSSIDENTYNQIKLYYDNEKTGRDVYVARDSSNINNWGVLQYYEALQEGEDGKTKADALLKLYNVKQRRLTIEKAFGDPRVRAGSLVGVIMDLGDVKVENYMLVETCKHTFSDGYHVMDLKLRGGEFVA